MRRLYILMTAIGIMIPVAVCACTSVIISGSVSPDGRPLMWKHRDTGFLENRLEHFKGEKFAFVSLVNSQEGKLGREVWIGSNTAGFSIMNTASYCLKEDDVPASEMDREGVLMYRALEICADLSDFEHFLDTLSRPMGVEANFGCIDARGGAAYYETWNDGYIKRDVSAMEDGYCVVTNFSVNGRREDWKGVERYRTASGIFSRQSREEGRFTSIGPKEIMDSLSRSYEHQGDSLHIPRYITSASVVIQGVKEGESPLNTVFWAALGYPLSSVMIPVPVSGDDHIPYYMKKSESSDNSMLCDFSLQLKKRIYPEGKNGPVDIPAAYEVYSLLNPYEVHVYQEFSRIHSLMTSGKISYQTYLKRYDKASKSYLPLINEGEIAHLIGISSKFD